jgi:hypothetical protein
MVAEKEPIASLSPYDSCSKNVVVNFSDVATKNITICTMIFLLKAVLKN